MLALCELTVSQERGFGSNHLVFLKARPQHAMERWDLRRVGALSGSKRAVSGSGAEGGSLQDHGGRVGPLRIMEAGWGLVRISGLKKGFPKISYAEGGLCKNTRSERVGGVASVRVD